MTYGYIRVSTDKQTVENQRFEIERFCGTNGLSIDGWIEETISGTKNYDKRKLGQLLSRVQAGDLILCAELSRLGRPKGALSRHVKLSGKEEAIRILRAEGTNWAQIARLLHVDRSTLARFAKSRLEAE